MNILKELNPNSVFKFFEQISAIPRGSMEEQQVSNWLVNFAKKRNLQVFQDNEYNVIIKKPASDDCDQMPGLIIQSHMDMVNEKNKGVSHDFTKDPLKLYIDGDFIKAKDTTLGADNGIAVAMSLAILDGNYTHPPISCLFTTNEESGMTGAKSVDPSLFKDYNYLINLDTDKEGEFTVGCAGGIRHSLQIPVTYINIPQEGYVSYLIYVKGLCGGHSGGDIDKNLANANRLMGRTLENIFRNEDVFLSYIEGGAKENAIPREALAQVIIPLDFEDNFNNIIKSLQLIFKNEYDQWEPNLTLITEKNKIPPKCFTKETTEHIILALMITPNGTLNKDKNGNVVSSSNIGVVKTTEEHVTIFSLSRSNIKTQSEFMSRQIICLADATNSNYNIISQNPPWEPKKESKLVDICTDVYKKTYNKDALITTTHGGLECGILYEKMPHLDIISFGPNNYNLHTPQEQLSISSSKRVFEFLLSVLEALATEA